MPVEDQPTLDEIAGYRQHRRQLLAARAVSTGIVVLVLTVLFEAAVFLFTHEQFIHAAFSYLALLLASAVPILAGRGPLRRWPEAVVLAADVLYTTAMVGLLLVPTTRSFGIEVFTAIKVMGTAVLIPYPPRVQAWSVSATLAAYWVLMSTTGRLANAGPDFAHLLTSPLFAGVLSTMGAIRSDHLRFELYRQRRALEHEARVSAHFAAIMSHELRNLLGAVLGYGEILSAVSRDHGDELEREAPERLQALARQGLDVINVTLELSRADTGPLSVARQRLPLGRLLRETESEFAARVTSATPLRWHVPDDLPEIDSDPVKLKMILRNLIGNALKFSERGGVDVRARCDGARVEIAIADSGIGISPADLPTIFEPFRQVGSSAGNRGGAGLGLYVVHRLVEALGGEIRAESEVGRGSTFTVSLPRQSSEGA